MPVVTTEPHLLETTLGKIDKLPFFSFNDLLSISILTAGFGTFPCFSCHHPSNSYHLLLQLTRLSFALVIHCDRWGIEGPWNGLSLVGFGFLIIEVPSCGAAFPSFIPVLRALNSGR